MGSGGRYKAQHSYNHDCSYIAGGSWEIRWTVDRYYAGSRLRFPTTYRRIADESGAKRFCQRWNVEFPPAKAPARRAPDG